MNRRLLLLSAGAVAFLLAPEAGALCPMCRTALESPEAAALAAAFNRGILFLLAVPFSAMGIIGLLIYREHQTPVTVAGVEEASSASERLPKDPVA